MPDYFEVVLFRRGDLRLTYAAPTNGQVIEPGAIVTVPIGKRFESGVVWGKVEPGDLSPSQIRPVTAELVKDARLDDPLRRLSEWISIYYDAPLGVVLENVVPAAIRKGARPKVEHWIQVVDDLDEDGFSRLSKRARKQAELYRYLCDQGVPLAESALADQFTSGRGLVKGLVEKGLVKREVMRQYREGYLDDLEEAGSVVANRLEGCREGEAKVKGAVVVEPPKFDLRDQQREAIEAVREDLRRSVFKTILLHGVTGSGKTEVYVQAILEACSQGKSALLLVPEITLAAQTVERVKGRCEGAGVGLVVWHSLLSEGEKYDAWCSMMSGRARVVVGARSAIFAPLANLGLVIVDEEHEGAYKQDESPRYHGRDVAVYRAFLEGAVCLLGSATPSLESIHNVRRGKYTCLKLEQRVDSQPLPLVEVVDMCVEGRRRDAHPLFSHQLIEKVRDRLARKEQTILFLNRRGFSRAIQCPDCGATVQCPHCAIAMTYHKNTESLICHLCGREDPVPSKCPSCGSLEHRRKGYGTEHLEKAAMELFPRARIVRLDADSMKRKNLFRRILADFRKGKIDILIGTQMVAKGLDFPNVTLVGVIDADIGLHLEDFRAPERTFHLLVQVSGRAGRGDLAGEVVVQSRNPHSPSIQFARRAEVEAFVEAELEMRRDYQYPPYRHLARHLFLSVSEEKASFAAQHWRREAEKRKEFPGEIRGPVLAPISKIRNEHRFQIWYFVANVRLLVAAIREMRQEITLPPDVRELLDVDAQSLQ